MERQEIQSKESQLTSIDPAIQPILLIIKWILLVKFHSAEGWLDLNMKVKASPSMGNVGFSIQDQTIAQIFTKNLLIKPA